MTGICFLFVLTSVAPIISGNELTINDSSNQSTLYVGGTGPGNYTSIQDAIDDASDGDTIYVFKGIYYENVQVDKSLTLTGENRDNTIIDAKRNGCPVSLKSNGITINGFTMHNSGGIMYNDAGIQLINFWDYDTNDNIIFNNKIINNCDGIFITTDNNQIYDNIIINNRYRGILTQGSNNNNISNNYFMNNSDQAIYFFNSDGNNVYSNYITGNNDQGIYISDSELNEIFGNIISNMSNGILIRRSFRNQIQGNSIINNKNGVNIDDSTTIVKENNFLNNEIDATFFYSVIGRLVHIGPLVDWISNYWDDHILPIPKIIIGKTDIEIPIYLYHSIVFTIPLINIDWTPAKQPYRIDDILLDIFSNHV